MRKYSFYTPEEIKYILDNGHMFSAEVIAKNIGRSKAGVRKVLVNNGIKLLPEFKRDINTRFKKGQTAWNAGLTLPNKPNSGNYTKGHIPANYKENGSITIRHNFKKKEVYAFIKINNEWVLYHRYIWEKTYGKIPKGLCLIFIDGNSLNTDINNLMLVTRKEHIIRNSRKYHSKKTFSDKHIAGFMSRKNPELRKKIMYCPELIDLKRVQLELTKVINEVENVA